MVIAALAYGMTTGCAKPVPFSESRTPVEAQPSASYGTLVTDTHTPKARFIPMDKPVDIGAAGRSGEELIVQPGVPDATVVSAQDAVDVAWRHNADLSPSSVTVEYGLLEGYPEWLVTFDDVCLIGPGRTIPPGVSPMPVPSCITQVTARIDAVEGKWIESFGSDT